MGDEYSFAEKLLMVLEDLTREVKLLRKDVKEMEWSSTAAALTDPDLNENAKCEEYRRYLVWLKCK